MINKLNKFFTDCFVRVSATRIPNKESGTGIIDGKKRFTTIVWIFYRFIYPQCDVFLARSVSIYPLPVITFIPQTNPIIFLR